jgi:hypothetical protein
MMFGLGRWYVLAKRVGRFLVHPIPRYVVSWLVAGAVAWQCTANSWDAFRDDKRPDGNSGHTAIDFGGQWIMGRMLVTGQTHFLYERNHLRNEIRAGYPRALEAPGQKNPDENGILGSFMGGDNPDTPKTFASCLLPLGAGRGVGPALVAAAAERRYWQPDALGQAAKPWVSGPLYPPINAFVYYPLGLLPPQEAYRAMQIALLAFALLAGLGVSRLMGGRIWLPVATALVIIYPGFSGAQTLGQNSPITLTILIWGWVLLAAGRPVGAGMVWGLLAFKPVWALAFFLVPLFTHRWRMCLAMAATGLAQVALTLPWVGVEGWLNWFEVGRLGANHYNVDQNWIFLSRDLLGIPRRLMLDFSDATPMSKRDRPEAALVGWVFLLLVLEITARLVTVRRDQMRAVTGPAPAFLLLGAWLSCYHFMYYDVLLSLLPLFLLFAEPRRYFEPRFLGWEPLVFWYPPELAPWRVATTQGRSPPGRVRGGVASFLALPGANYGWIANPFALLALVFVVLNEQVLEPNPDWFPEWLRIFKIYGFPWNTVCLLVLWLWCAWLWVRQPRDTQKQTSAYGQLPLTAVELER